MDAMHFDNAEVLAIADELNVPGMRDRAFGQFVERGEPQRHEQRTHHIAVTNHNHDLSTMIADDFFQDRCEARDRLRFSTAQIL